MMNPSLSNSIRGLFSQATILACTLGIPVLATATEPPSLTSPNAAQHSSSGGRERSPLIDKVRNATARFRDINALSSDWVRATPCVSGPDFGAMGVHFVLPARLGDAALNADEPEALIYEPLSGGAFRLVGVEFIVFASAWESQDPKPAGPPSLEGHLLNFVDAPNRFGLEPFYELHVWAWENNPTGSFADWNARVSCEKQPSE
jgi:hypothetical protein